MASDFSPSVINPGCSKYENVSVRDCECVYVKCKTVAGWHLTWPLSLWGNVTLCGHRVSDWDSLLSTSSLICLHVRTAYFYTSSPALSPTSLSFSPLHHSHLSCLCIFISLLPPSLFLISTSSAFSPCLSVSKACHFQNP